VAPDGSWCGVEPLPSASAVPIAPSYALSLLVQLGFEAKIAIWLIAASFGQEQAVSYLTSYIMRMFPTLDNFADEVGGMKNGCPDPRFKRF
jgi:hypothetical protein